MVLSVDPGRATVCGRGQMRSGCSPLRIAEEVSLVFDKLSTQVVQFALILTTSKVTPGSE